MKLIANYVTAPTRAIFMQDYKNYYEFSLACGSPGRTCLDPVVTVRWGKHAAYNEEGQLEVWMDAATSTGRYMGNVPCERTLNLEQAWRHALEHPELYVSQATIPAMPVGV